MGRMKELLLEQEYQEEQDRLDQLAMEEMMFESEMNNVIERMVGDQSVFETFFKRLYERLNS